jgi:hypothetical protein
MRLRPLRQRMRARVGAGRSRGTRWRCPGPRVSTTLSVLGVHGFGARLVVGLINRGLVMIMYERAGAGSTMIDVTNVPNRA